MTYARRNFAVKHELHGVAFRGYAGCSTLAGMAGRRTYLAEWRKFRGLTQVQVVDRLSLFDDPNLPKTTASLSRIENGRQPYGQPIIEALADIYTVAPGELLDRHPEREGRILDILHRLPAGQQDQAARVLEAMAEFKPAPHEDQPLVA